MKKGLLLLTICASVVAYAGKKKKKDKCEASCAPKALVLSNEMDSVNYAIGIIMHDQIKQMKLDTIKTELVKQGMDGSVKQDTIMTVEEASQVLNAYITAAQEKENEKNIKEGKDYLANNKQREGVMVTPTGLQYEVIKEGLGAKPQATDQVTVHYHGTTIDGNVFDSSIERGQPATFGLNQVIKGWTEGVQLMSVGSKYKFFIPYELGYGARGAGGAIPPYATLIFEVELLSIQ